MSNITSCSKCGKDFNVGSGDCKPNMCGDCTAKWLSCLHNYQQGWVCPKCGAVMSPYERSCVNCKGITQYVYPYI